MFLSAPCRLMSDDDRSLEHCIKVSSSHQLGVGFFNLALIYTAFRCCLHLKYKIGNLFPKLFTYGKSYESLAFKRPSVKVRQKNVPDLCGSLIESLHYSPNNCVPYIIFIKVSISKLKNPN